MKSAVSRVGKTLSGIGLMMLSPFLSAVLSAEAITLTLTDPQGDLLPDEVVFLPETRAVSPAQTRVMDQIDKRFVPHVLVARAGDKVLFPNSDNIRHHVYSFSEARPFELKLYSGKPEAPVSFDQPGLVVLGCNIHDSMLGYILVTEAAVFGVTDARGQVTLKVPDGVGKLHIWHERYSTRQSAVMGVSLTELRASQWRMQVPLAIAASPGSASAPGNGLGNRMRN